MTFKLQQHNARVAKIWLALVALVAVLVAVTKVAASNTEIVRTKTRLDPTLTRKLPPAILNVIASPRVADRPSINLSVMNESQTLPQLSGWPKLVELGNFSYSSPTIADIDGDTQQEVIFGTSWKMYVFRADDSPAAGLWPQTIPSVLSAPAVEDLDDDGTKEIIHIGNDPFYPNDGRLYVFRADGSSFNAAVWPKSLSSESSSSPAIGDLDPTFPGLEIVHGASDGRVYAWHLDGSAVSGWPQLAHPSISYSTAVGDLDGDGLLEVVTTSYNGYVYAFHHDGSLMSGWPQPTSDAILSTPVIADLDVDGKAEVVASSLDKKVYAWHGDSTPVVGWPQRTNYAVNASPTVVDLDNDGSPEVLAANGWGLVYAWRADGALLSNWPVDLGIGFGAFQSPVIADVNGDGHVDVILYGNNCCSATMFAIDKGGVLLPDWPKISPDYFYRGVPSVADVDNNGTLEIFIEGSTRGNTYLNALTLPDRSSSTSVPWPTIRHDNQRTGYYLIPPSPTTSTIPQCIMLLPGANDTYTVPGVTSYQPFTMVVRDGANHPLPNTPVVIDFSQATDLVLATTQAPGVTVDCASKTVTVTTDSNGSATFVVRGTGRNSAVIPAGPGGVNQVKVFAHGVLLKNITATTPDQNGAAAGGGLNGIDNLDRSALQNDSLHYPTTAGRSNLNCNQPTADPQTIVDGSDLSVFFTFLSGDSTSRALQTTTYCSSAP